MSSDLEKIDIIRARTGVGYNEARQALEDAGGDVVQALINLEEKNEHFCKRMKGSREDVMGRMKELWNRGQETKIKVKKGERTVFEVPATVGALGLIGAAVSSEVALLGVLGGAAAMVKNYRLEIDKGTGDKEEREPEDKNCFGPRDLR